MSSGNVRAVVFRFKDRASKLFKLALSSSQLSYLSFGVDLCYGFWIFGKVHTWMDRRLRSSGRPRRVWPSVVISVLVGGGFFALPFYLASGGQRGSGGYQLTQADRPLKFNAPKRGAFVNSGSFDAGIE